jgi:hypothetical protein
VRDADHSPPFSAKVKYEQELYLLSPHVPPWHVAGQLPFYSVLSFITVCINSSKSKLYVIWITNTFGYKVSVSINIEFIYLLSQTEFTDA